MGLHAYMETFAAACMVRYDAPWSSVAQDTGYFCPWLSGVNLLGHAEQMLRKREENARLLPTEADVIVRKKVEEQTWVHRVSLELCWDVQVADGRRDLL